MSVFLKILNHILVVSHNVKTEKGQIYLIENLGLDKVPWIKFSVSWSIFLVLASSQARLAVYF